jgi:serine O-acetyltransferase
MRENIRADRERLITAMALPRGILGRMFVWTMPSIVALRLYRWSHWLYGTRFRQLAWPVWSLNVYITGADISPTTQIGPGCYLGHAVGCAINGKIGRNALIFGGAVIGGGRGHGDVGGGDGLPVVGDNLVMGHGAKIIGPITVGDNVTVGALSLVLHDVPAGSVVVGVPARVVKARADSVDFEALAVERLQQTGRS